MPWVPGGGAQAYRPLSVEELRKLDEKAPVHEVKISDLIATQRGVNLDEVEKYEEGKEIPKGTVGHTGIVVDHPTVIQRRGRLFLFDGHHRTVSRRMAGKDSIEARVVDVDRALDRKGLKAWARP